MTCRTCGRLFCFHSQVIEEKPYWLKSDEERRKVTFIEPPSFVFAPYVPIVRKK